MSNYNRRLAKLEPRPHHNERVEEAGRRIYAEMFRWREWLLGVGPPTRYAQGQIDEAARYCGGFEPTSEAAP